MKSRRAPPASEVIEADAELSGDANSLGEPHLSMAKLQPAEPHNVHAQSLREVPLVPAELFSELHDPPTDHDANIAFKEIACQA